MAHGLVRALTTVDDDLFQPLIEPGHGVGSLFGGALVAAQAVAARVVASAQIVLGHALDLARQRVETFVDGGKVRADLVVEIVIIVAD